MQIDKKNFFESTPEEVLLIANGALPSEEVLQIFRNVFPVWYAVDGAANSLVQKNYRPDAVLGDFDSITPENLNSFPESSRIFLKDQDYTDLEKSISFFFSRGTQKIHVLGASGLKVGHGIHQFELLHKYNREDRSLIAWNTTEKWTVVSDQVSFHRKKNSKLSFFALGATVKIRETYGLEYNLKNQELKFGEFSSVSNRILEDQAGIEIDSGFLLYVCEHTPEELLTELSESSLLRGTR